MGHVVQLLGYPEALHVWMMDDDGVCLPVSPVSLVYVQQHCRTSLVIEFGLWWMACVTYWISHPFVVG